MEATFEIGKPNIIMLINVAFYPCVYETINKAIKESPYKPILYIL